VGELSSDRAFVRIRSVLVTRRFEPLGLASTSLSDCGFAVNGRFFGQPITGVQRYGREVVRALDGMLASTGRRGAVFAPARDLQIPKMEAFALRQVGPIGGHVWEQTVLPIVWSAPLLNLCNTGPVARAAQVVCIHDANVFRMPESYGMSFRLLYQSLQPLLARRCAYIATVSEDSARQLACHLPVEAKDLIVLPDGHEHVFRWNGSASKLFEREPQERPFVLLLGSRAKHKNAGLVLRLAEPLDAMGLDILVAGGTAGIFDQEELKGGRNVRFLGKVTDDDLALLFSRALCLAFPSITEGFGLPIVEAMALGCPVISSDRASMPEVCGDAALMAAPDDPRAWLAHFAALHESPSLRDNLRGRGRERVALFSWLRTANGYSDLIRTLQ
jgi:glycosyltransferase involved in cell wall biosynthesis